MGEMLQNRYGVIGKGHILYSDAGSILEEDIPARNLDLQVQKLQKSIDGGH